MQSIKFNHMEVQFGFECLAIVLLALAKCIAGLRCYECLSLTCDTPVICESIKNSMSDPLFYPKPMHIEFRPNSSCPAEANSTLWSNFSHECPIGDSACLEATVEVTTTYNGRLNSLKVEPYSTLTSLGYIRACASRKYLKSRIDATITHKDDAIRNDTLNEIIQSLGSQDKSNYTILTIHSHEIYVDQGTEDSVTCYQDNCNDNTRRNAAAARNSSTKISLPACFNILLIVIMCSKISTISFN